MHICISGISQPAKHVCSVSKDLSGSSPRWMKNREDLCNSNEPEQPCQMHRLWDGPSVALTYIHTHTDTEVTQISPPRPLSGKSRKSRWLMRPSHMVPTIKWVVNLGWPSSGRTLTFLPPWKKWQNKLVWHLMSYHQINSIFIDIAAVIRSMLMSGLKKVYSLWWKDRVSLWVSQNVICSCVPFSSCFLIKVTYSTLIAGTVPLKL